MELRQLQYFLAVAEELHFGRAAEKLHMSQPPLSVQVTRLESEFGTPLFERTTRQVRLLPAGLHLQERARAILGDLEALREEMRDYADGVAGSLNAGFVSSANYTVLPGVTRLFREQRPAVVLNLHPLTSGEQIERLRKGTLDVGIVRDEDPDDDSLVSEVVYEERLVACLSLQDPLAGRAEVTAADIKRVPMITYPSALMPGFVARVSRALSEAPGEIRVVQEVVHQETALGFVAAGVGTSILPESVQQLLPPSIAAVPLAGSPTSRLLAVRPRNPRSGIASVFTSCLHQAAAALAG